MRMIGLIGGMSWESTALYYAHLNRLARERLGGLHSARLLLWSVDFAEVARLQHEARWDEAAALLVDAARSLEAGGAAAIVLCTNTMHKLADSIQAAIDIPLLHIADATGRAMRDAGAQRPVLLATRFTMEETFYRDRLHTRFGIDALIPDEGGRQAVHRIIYEELCRGIVTAESRATMLGEVYRLRDRGADSVILGCTEVAMLVGPDDVDLPLFDTTACHAEAAMTFALDRSILTA